MFKLFGRGKDESRSSVDYALVALPEEVDAASCAGISARLMNLVLSGRYAKVVVDFSITRYIDSAGIGVLERARREFTSRGGELVLAGLNRSIRRIFSITGMDRVFPIFDTVTDGIGSQATLPTGFADSVPGIPYKKHDQLAGNREVLGVLDKGGMGVVYLIQNHSTGGLSALKTYRDEYIKSGAIRQRFLEEGRLWAQLGRHLFLTSALAVFEHEGRPYVEMEYIAPDMFGRVTLRDHMKDPQRLFSERRLLRWGIQFCQGMEHAQANGLKCHRDIKPENLMVTPHAVRDGDVTVFSSSLRILKISDFGLAKALDSEPSAEVLYVQAGGYHASLSLRKTGGCGTPPYMPPEQFEFASAADIRSDIYSFGVVLYELASGHLPFIPSEAGGDVFQLWYATHATKSPKPLNHALWPIIEKCLMKKPDHRFQTIADLRSELERMDKDCKEQWTWPYPF